MKIYSALSPLLLGPLAALAGLPAHAADPPASQGPVAVAADVFAHQKLDQFQGDFGGELAAGDEFGHAVAAIGDLDGNLVPDLLVGAPGWDPSSFSRGALWVVFLEADGTALGQTRISAGTGGFVGPNDTNGCFGRAIARLGDIDGDSFEEVAVGQPQDCTLFAHDEGVLWLLSLGPGGVVLGERRVGEGMANFGGNLDDNDAFGHALVALGDLDGNGATELAVGAPGDDDGGLNTGAVWVLFLDPGGTVLSEVKIATGQGGLAGLLSPTDEFGSALANLGDWDGNGAPELAVGAQRTDGAGVSRGGVWILELGTSGEVLDEHFIGDGIGGFTGTLEDTDRFGTSLAFLGDVDGDGIGDLAVGADGSAGSGDEFTLPGMGSVWILHLNADFSVKSQREITQGVGGFTGDLSAVDRFGSSLAALPNLDQGSLFDLAVGAWGDSTDGADKGATWTLFLDTPLAAALEIYGCGANPPGSLVPLAGLPIPGTSFTLGVDNPLGTQPPGSIGLVLPSLGSAPGLVPFLQPCGILVPGWGMSAPGALGELLVDVGKLVGSPLVGGGWVGPGSPVPVVVSLPPNSGLVGVEAFLQGVMYDPTGAMGTVIGLSEGVRVTIGV